MSGLPSYSVQAPSTLSRAVFGQDLPIGPKLFMQPQLYGLQRVSESAVSCTEWCAPRPCARRRSLPASPEAPQSSLLPSLGVRAGESPNPRDNVPRSAKGPVKAKRHSSQQALNPTTRGLEKPQPKSSKLHVTAYEALVIPSSHCSVQLINRTGHIILNLRFQLSIFSCQSLRVSNQTLKLLN